MSHAVPVAGLLTARAFRFATLGLLLIAAAWRLSLAAAMPVPSRDAVVFCEYARALNTRGLAHLRAPETRQHPLYPLLIVGAARVAQAGGAPDTPLTWLRSGQAVALLAGLAVVVLTGLLTLRTIRSLDLPLDARVCALLAMALAAVLDLNTWLSADAMSDEVHLAFYLGAVILLLRLRSPVAALACGVLAGLAFLTREEGFLPLLAGLAAIAAGWRAGRVPVRAPAGPATAATAPPAGLDTRRALAGAAALLLGFLACAAPYWTAVGRFSTKKDWRDVLEAERGPGTAAAADHRSGRVNEDDGLSIPIRLHVAKLELIEPAWYALVPIVVERTFRAGRVVIPLLAVLPLVNLRRRLLGPVLVGLTTCLAGHFVLTCVLLERFGYLHPRHALVTVHLLVPFAAMLLGRLVQLQRERRRPGLAVALIVAALLPGALYARRVPNAADTHLAEAVRWLVADDAQGHAQRLLGGSSTRRIAFLADLPWEQWYEEADDTAGLAEQILAGPPGYFAIELAAAGREPDSFELRGNRALLERLVGDARVAPRLRLAHTVARAGGGELRLYRIGP